MPDTGDGSAHRGRTCVRLSALLVLAGATASAQEPDPATLLHSVAARYSSATDYTFSVRTKSETSSFDLTLAASRPRQFMAHQKSRTSDPFELLLVADADTAWGYQPRRRLYTRSGPGPGEAREELARLHDRYFARFAQLDRLDATAELHGLGSVHSVDCVRIVLTGRTAHWTEELWIDPARQLVLKSVVRRPRPLPETGDLVTTATWSAITIGTPPDPARFSFSPPSGARRTNTLENR